MERYRDQRMEQLETQQNQTNKNAEQGAVANPLRRRSSQVLW